MLLIWLASFTLIALTTGIALITTDNAPKKSPDIVWSLLFGVLGASVLVCLLAFIHWLRCWRNVRRLLIGMAFLATLIAIFYAEEDWRGWRAWEKCKHELEAKGVVMDWDKFIPPPVPDDQNFFKAPKMAEWFVKNRKTGANELNDRLRNADTTVTSLNEAAAAKYLAWSDQFEPDFDSIREALKRPCARMDGDYSVPYEIPIPNFVAVRIVAQTLAQRAKCDLLLGLPDKALQELTLMHDMCRLLEAAPTGKPMTLVSAMINVAVTGLYVSTIADGLQRHAWQEPQLAALQKQLAEINLTPFVFEALQEEPAGLCRTAQITPAMKFFNLVSGSEKWGAKSVGLSWPRGWTYQNMVNVAARGQQPLEGFDLAHDTVAPRKFEQATRNAEEFVGHGKSPYRILAAIAMPNITKATQSLAHNQTLANEAQIVCALERYRLAHDEYPGTLDALAPQFIEKLPHDIIGGQPLIYRRTGDGKFLLYSVGWNETDDDGEVVLKKDGSEDWGNGDWVWKN